MSSSSQPIATVFGASGFVSRYIVSKLVADGYQVRAASRHPSRSRHLLPMGAVDQVQRVYAPVQEADKVARAVEGASIVINTVGILAGFGKDQTFDKTMHIGAETIAQASADAGVKTLIHISAIGASHDAPSQYGRAKAAGEDGVLAAFPTASILRPSIIFGVEDGFFNRFAVMPFVPLIGGGKTNFQPVYVNDVAKAAQACWQNPAAHAGKIFELGGPQALSFRQCMDIMCDVIGADKPMVHVPWGIAEIMGAVGNVVPGAPITGDQVKSLSVDNVVTDDAAGFDALGIQPTDLRAILPTYLDKYMDGGKLGSYNPG